MKRILFLLTALPLIVVGPMISRAAEPARQTATAETPQQKEEYERSMEEQLRDIGKRLDELRAKANARTEEVRKEMNQYLKDAEKKQAAARRQLEETRKATSEKWKKFTSDMNKAADEFEKAYERAKQHFKE